MIHKANHSLARRSSGETPHVTEAPGVADLRFDLGNLAADMEPIAADGSKGNFDALPAECRKLSGDVQTAKGDMSAEIASDVRTDVNAMLTLLGEGVQSCAAGDNEAAAQSFNQALAEMTQATIELNR